MNAAFQLAQRYVRTTEKPQLRLNKQNEHIAEAFDRCNFALIDLVRRGITITRVTIGDEKPEIEIMDSPEARRLASVTIYNNATALRVQRVAYLNDCRIVWETTNEC